MSDELPPSKRLTRSLTHVAILQQSEWVARWIGTPTGSARLLDYASGSGRHCKLAQDRGFHVLAIDIDESCLNVSESRNSEARVEDLESGRWSFAAERFEVVVVTNFLFRARLDLLAGLLQPGGRLVYETFALGNEAHGRPSSPRFLLQDDELFVMSRRAGLQVVAFEQGYVTSPKPARVQRVVAVKPPYDPQSLPLDGRPAALS